MTISWLLVFQWWSNSCILYWIWFWYAHSTTLWMVFCGIRASKLLTSLEWNFMIVLMLWLSNSLIMAWYVIPHEKFELDLTKPYQLLFSVNWKSLMSPIGLPVNWLTTSMLKCFWSQFGYCFAFWLPSPWSIFCMSSSECQSFTYHW